MDPEQVVTPRAAPEGTPPSPPLTPGGLGPSEIAPELVVARRHGDVLLRHTILKADHFPGCQNMALGNAVPGAPNFRSVPGLPIYGTAIPTAAGVRAVLDKLSSELLEEDCAGPAGAETPDAGAVGDAAPAASEAAALEAAAGDVVPGLCCEAGACGAVTPAATFHERPGDAGGGRPPRPPPRRVLWHNLREEPVIYVNGVPYVVREAERPFANLEYTGIDRARVEAMEARLKADVLAEAARYDGAVLVAGEDDAFQVVEKWEPVTEEDVQTPAEVYAELVEDGYDVEYLRVPVTDEKAPKPRDFELLVSRLWAAPRDAALVFNCQMGRGRTTTGMIIASLLWLRAELPAGLPFAPPPRPLTGLPAWFVDPAAAEAAGGAAEAGAGERGGSEGPGAAVEPARRPRRDAELRRGMFGAVRSLLRALSNGPAGKAALDLVVDACSAMQNLRSAIADYRARLARESNDARRGELLGVCLEYLERYFTLLCFSSYLGGPHFRPWEADPSAHGRPPGSRPNTAGSATPSRAASPGLGDRARWGGFPGAPGGALAGPQGGQASLPATPVPHGAAPSASGGSLSSASGPFRHVPFADWIAARPELRSILVRLLRTDPLAALALDGAPRDAGKRAAHEAAAAAAAAEDEGAAEDTIVASQIAARASLIASRAGAVLGPYTVLKQDHFPGCQSERLPRRVPGAPNFRSIPGVGVYGGGIATLDGMRAVLREIGAGPAAPEGDGVAEGAGSPSSPPPAPSRKAVWVVMREEPVVLLRGLPYVLRDAARPFKNLLEYRGIDAARLDLMESRLRQDVLAEAASRDGKLLVVKEEPAGDEDEEGVAAAAAPPSSSPRGGGPARDLSADSAGPARDASADATGPAPPLGRRLVDEYLPIRGEGDVQTLRAAFAQLKSEGYRVEYVRVPVTDGAPPTPRDLDAFYAPAAACGPDDALIYSCQLGGGRTTIGMVVGVLLRRYLHGLAPAPPSAEHLEAMDQLDDDVGGASPTARGGGASRRAAPFGRADAADDGRAGGAGEAPPAPGPARAALPADPAADDVQSPRVAPARRGPPVDPTRASDWDVESARLRDGEYVGVMRFTRTIERGPEAKAAVDLAVDAAGALLNLRTTISRYRIPARKERFYRAELSARHIAFSRGASYLERYCLLIAYASFLSNQARSGRRATFEAWFAARPEVGAAVEAIRANPAGALAPAPRPRRADSRGPAPASARARGEGARAPGPRASSLRDSGSAAGVAPPVLAPDGTLLPGAPLPDEQPPLVAPLYPAAALRYPASSPLPRAAASDERVVLGRRRGALLARRTILKSLPGVGPQGRWALALGAELPGVVDVRVVRRLPPADGERPAALAPPPVLAVGDATVEGLRSLLRLLGAGPGGPAHASITDTREELCVVVRGRAYVRRDPATPAASMHHAGVSGVRLEDAERRLRADLVAEAVAFGGRVMLHRELRRAGPVYGSEATTEVPEPASPRGSGKGPVAGPTEGGAPAGASSPIRAPGEPDAAPAASLAASRFETEDVTRPDPGSSKAGDIEPFWSPLDAAGIGDVDEGAATPLEVAVALGAEGFSLSYRRVPLSRERTPTAADLDALGAVVEASPPANRRTVHVILSRSAAGSSARFAAAVLALHLAHDRSRARSAARARAREGLASSGGSLPRVRGTDPAAAPGDVAGDFFASPESPLVKRRRSGEEWREAAGGAPVASAGPPAPGAPLDAAVAPLRRNDSDFAELSRSVASGEWRGVMNLCRVLRTGLDAKAAADAAIDACAELGNLREDVLRCAVVASDPSEGAVSSASARHLGLHYLRRYYLLVAYADYLDAVPPPRATAYSAWFHARAELRYLLGTLDLV